MYDNIIEKFKNKNFFNNFFANVNSQRKLRYIKIQNNNALHMLTTITTGIIFYSIFSIFFFYMSEIEEPTTRIMNSMFINLPVFVIFSLISSIFISHIKECYSNKKLSNFPDKLEQLNIELLKELKANSHLLQDIAQLVVDDETEAIFHDLVDHVINNKSHDIIQVFDNLINKYNSYAGKNEGQDKRKEFFNKEKIAINKEPKEMYHL